jgi:cyclopropane fatty-acyl-phospholipid synthase-like methyltransferase
VLPEWPLFYYLFSPFLAYLFHFYEMKPDVAAYYNQTQNHYQRWWQLAKGMALHYGLWYNDTRTFLEALNNTNQHLADLAAISEDQVILDAGCGVGGSSIYLAKTYGAQVTGITLSDVQVKTARRFAERHQVSTLTDFKVLDYCDTKIQNKSFDVIWACESSSSAPDKVKMAKEWFRLLKPGGRLVLSDFFKTTDDLVDSQELLSKWAEIWAMSPLVTATYLTQCLDHSGFQVRQVNNLTQYITKTVTRMYLSYWLGLVPSVIYNTIFGARIYARNHYKSGLYQYKSRQQNLWQYQSILATKPGGHSSAKD